MTFFFGKLGSLWEVPEGHKLRRICGFILLGILRIFFVEKAQGLSYDKTCPHSEFMMMPSTASITFQAVCRLRSKDRMARFMCCICFRPICLPILGWTLELWFCPSSMPVVLSFRLSFFAKSGRCKRVTRDSHGYDMTTV